MFKGNMNLQGPTTTADSQEQGRLKVSVCGDKKRKILKKSLNKLKRK